MKSQSNKTEVLFSATALSARGRPRLGNRSLVRLMYVRAQRNITLGLEQNAGAKITLGREREREGHGVVLRSCRW